MRSAQTPTSYKRSYLMRGDELNVSEGSVGFDVVTELVFAGRAAHLSWRNQLSQSSSGQELISQDELNFLDRSRTTAYVVEETRQRLELGTLERARRRRPIRR